MISNLIIVHPRNDPKGYKNQEDFVRLEGAVKYDFNQSAKKKQLKADLDAQTKSRQMSTGIVKFIGELFNAGFMNHIVMDLCMKELLQTEEKPTELSIECFHILLTTIGAKFESCEKGIAAVDKNFGVLEQIVDKYADKICLKVRRMILELWELRANSWKHETLEKVEREIINEAVRTAGREKQKEIIKASKATQEFLKNISDVLCQIEPKNLLQFMDSFLDVKLTNEENMSGAVKIIFERAISKADELSMFAIVCKGLADVTWPTTDNQGERVNTTFKDALMTLCHREIDQQREHAKSFRDFGEQLANLKYENDSSKYEQMKSRVEGNLISQERSLNAAKFFSELFNVDFLESRFIFDYLTFLLTPAVISSTSLECFCAVITTVGSKMIAEKNRDVLLKDMLLKLFDASKTVELSQRVRFIVKDVVCFGRYQLRLMVRVDYSNEINAARQFRLPCKTNFSMEPLWETNAKTEAYETTASLLPPPGFSPLN